jgi:hypothetical protein
MINMYLNDISVFRSKTDFVCYLFGLFKNQAIQYDMMLTTFSYMNNKNP